MDNSPYARIATDEFSSFRPNGPFVGRRITEKAENILNGRTTWTLEARDNGAAIQPRSIRRLRARHFLSVVRCSLRGMKKLGDFTTAHTLSDQEIVSGLAHVDATEKYLAAARMAMLAEADRRRLAKKLGHGSVKRWYADAVRIPEFNAEKQISLGYWLGERRTVADALSDGTIHAAHARAIADGLALVVLSEPTLTDSAQPDVVRVLLDVATRSTARAVTERAQELAHHAASDAAARFEEEQRRREQERKERERTKAEDPVDNLHPDPAPDQDPNPDDPPPGPPPTPMSENTALNTLGIFLLANGRSKIDGNVDKFTAEKLLTALSPLSAPTPAPDGTLDHRSASQRRADGFSLLLDRYLGDSRPPGKGGTGDVALLVNFADLMKKDQCPQQNSTATRTDSNPDDSSDANPPSDNVPEPSGPGERSERDWPFQLDWTGPISRQLAEYLSCDASMTPVIVDGAGVPLMLGKSVRLATPGQRNAVVIRDRCCVKCGRPAAWCQVHHVVYWQHGGATDLNNLALVCGECHRIIHTTEWELVMGDDGHPYVVPPASEDPSRKPHPSYHRRRKHAA